jgi:D-glycero-alpha-D-manno-heptose-7-phosphate kinase
MYAHAWAPVRIGIAGGGTDLPAWTGAGRVGRCLSLAVASYTHAVAILRPDRRVVASYRHLDEARSATEIANGLVRESALMHGFEDGFEVHTLSELSSRGSGLGVSSSIAVSLAACFRRLAGLRRGSVTEPRWADGGEAQFRGEVARDAWTVEIERLRRPVGRQDHVAAAWGGLRLYKFEEDRADLELSYPNEAARWVADHLLLIELPDGHDARQLLGGVSIENLEEAAAAVVIAQGAVQSQDAHQLGAALWRGQKSKTQIPGAVPKPVAKVVERLEDHPRVTGCKIAGAGGGGHLVVALESSEEAAVKQLIGDIRDEFDLRAWRPQPDLAGLRSEAHL